MSEINPPNDTNISAQPASIDDHEWYHSETDKAPIAKKSNSFTTGNQQVAEGTGRSQRNKQISKFDKVLQQEKLDEWGNSSLKPPPAAPSRKRSSRKLKKLRTGNAPHDLSDKDDGDFDDSSSETESVESGDASQVSNDEVVSLLPSKSMPLSGERSKRKRSKRTATKKSSHRTLSANASVASLQVGSATVTDVDDANSVTQLAGAATTKTRNAIYYFYDLVDRNDKGETGQPGDKHYKCFHGNRGVFTITKASRYNLGSLVRNLKAASAPMFNLYSAINGRQATQEEIDLASGKTPFDPSKHNSYIKSIQVSQLDIRHALQNQANAAAGPWDQVKFENMLAEWIVLTDQPFDLVDNTAFRELVTYVHHPAPELKIPHRDAMKRRIMKLGEDTVRSTKQMFAEIEGKISISLDAWTSSNNYAFLAIVAHYVNKNGDLEELLIDFRELVGEHSGENMAEVVWESLVRFGIHGRIMSFMMDNATNNDTFIDGIVSRAKEVNIHLNASWIRLRCLPHTVHLAAIKLLEGLGVVSSVEAKKARSRSGNYQLDSDAFVKVSKSATQDSDSQDEEDTSGLGDGDSESPLSLKPSSEDNIMPGVDKLRKIVRAVRSSPQRKKNWLNQIKSSLVTANNPADNRKPLMLILDVKTRWSSTHQMLERALMFQFEIDSFTLHIKDLRQLFISEDEWEAIKLVCGWLLNFREATRRSPCSSIIISPINSTNQYHNVPTKICRNFNEL